MSFDEVDEQLTLHRYNDLCRFWRKCPPVATLLAGYVGYKPPEPDTDVDATTEMDEESMAALAEVFGLPVKVKGN